MTDLSLVEDFGNGGKATPTFLGKNVPLRVYSFFAPRLAENGLA